MSEVYERRSENRTYRENQALALIVIRYYPVATEKKISTRPTKPPSSKLPYVDPAGNFNIDELPTAPAVLTVSLEAIQHAKLRVTRESHLSRETMAGAWSAAGRYIADGRSIGPGWYVRWSRAVAEWEEEPCAGVFETLLRRAGSQNPIRSGAERDLSPEYLTTFQSSTI